MFLPTASGLATAPLNAVFNSTTNSYKFYWFLAILKNLHRGNILEMNDLRMQMVSDVWFPLNFYHVSFGSQDGFKTIADLIVNKFGVKIDNKKELFGQLNQALLPAEKALLFKQVETLTRYVPWLIVRPFFNQEFQGIVNPEKKIEKICTELFEKESERVIYRFAKDSIEINPRWHDYFSKHQAILRGFTFWHLVKFLQRNNPNVIGLSEKLEPPTDSERNLKKESDLWKAYLLQNGTFSCIYSGQPVLTSDLSLDHFLPWSYVVHNQQWNLVPISRSENSSKNNRLPNWKTHFEPFAHAQFSFFGFLKQQPAHHEPVKKTLEQYQMIGIRAGESLIYPIFRKKLEQAIFPQYQIAQNSGFQPWQKK